MGSLLLILLLAKVAIAYNSNNFKETQWSFSFGSYEQKNKNLRIIGGQEAPLHSFPYQVGIYIRRPGSTDFCGGSLISSNYVLTAAHCAEGATSMNLVLGAQNITEREPTQVRQTSTSFIIHPSWNRPKYAYDIAVVKLSSPINTTDAIQIIKVVSGNSTYAGETGSIAGWGKTSNNQTNITPILRYVNNTIMSNEACKNYDSEYKAILHSTMMCFSGFGIVGSCGGDSGGPLVVNNEQVGIISFGKTDCTAGNPSVMTRLTQFYDWLKNNTDIDV